jgi:hypothetical protein
VEGEYHQKAHRGIGGETPLDQWLRLSEGIRSLPPEVDLDELFLEETTRRVRKDGTLTLRGKTFEVGPVLVGERVKVHFDPFDLRRVLVQDREEVMHEAWPVDLYGNRFVRRDPPQEPPAPKSEIKLRSLEDLLSKSEEAKGRDDTNENKRDKESQHET